MTEPIALFGLTVKPGDVHRMDVLRDFRITNVSLGESVKGTSRVVVKVHLIPQSGHPITEEEELLEGLMDDDDDDDDEEEDDQDEDEDEKEEKEEDDDDDEDDEDLETERAMKQYPERTFVLCTLTPGKIEQVAVNINFSEAEEIGFSVTGDNEVDLLGNYLAPAGDFDQEPYDSDSDYDSEYDSEIDSDEAGSFNSDDDDEEYDSEDFDADGLEAILAQEDSDEEDADDSERFESIGDVPSVAATEKTAAAVAPSKKRKALAEPSAEADVSMASSVGVVSDAELAKAAAAEGLDVSKLSKAQRKRLNKKLKTAAGGDGDVSIASTSSKPEAVFNTKVEVVQNGKTAKTAEKQTVTKDGQQTSKTKTPSGLIIEVKKAGEGPVAKKGQKAGMRYIGKLTNGKVFDSNTKGKPFSFKLGKGEVIKAWDEGVVGMKVGEERRLTCPPNLAYGTSGAPPDIPKNATLVFDIKLVDLK